MEIQNIKTAITYPWVVILGLIIFSFWTYLSLPLLDVSFSSLLTLLLSLFGSWLAAIIVIGAIGAAFSVGDP